MSYTVDDAIELHHTITARIKTQGADATFRDLCNTDPELLALALTLHMIQKVPHAAA